MMCTTKGTKSAKEPLAELRRIYNTRHFFVPFVVKN